jgi:hypothetical protein
MGSGGKAPPVFASALDEDELSALCYGRFSSEDRALSTHWIRSWVGLRTGVDSVENRKSCTAGNQTRNVQPVASPCAT